MEDREQHRRGANQVRAGLHRAPRDCALGMPALHTQPVGWAASRARGSHSERLCQEPLPSLLLHPLSLLSPTVLSCDQVALQRARTRSRERSWSLRSALRGSGAPQLLSCCAAAHLDVCNGILCSRQQSVVAIPVAFLAQTAASIVSSPHVALAGYMKEVDQSGPRTRVGPLIKIIFIFTY